MTAKQKILRALRAHLKTKKHRRPDWDYSIGGKKKEMYAYNNGWGADQESGFIEAMDVIKKMKL